MAKHAKPPRKSVARSLSTTRRAARCGALSTIGFGRAGARSRWRWLFTAGLAATTGGYPLIIKHSFDTLMKADSGALPWVLVAIVGVTCARGLFLYLHQVTATRIVMRMTTDIQKAAFAHLISADYARLTRETTGHWCRASPTI